MPVSQDSFLEAVAVALGVRPIRDYSAPWLLNKPLEDHFAERYSSAMAVFDALKGDRHGLEQKKTMRLAPDAYLPDPFSCLVEYDELQHFTRFKELALTHYPMRFDYGFEVEQWLDCCRRHFAEAESKGAAGYRAPTKDFPFEGGRHAQRAFFDMIRDFVPPLHGLRATVRVSEFEFGTVVGSPKRLRILIESKLD